jgi:hypothetical protein
VPRNKSAGRRTEGPKIDADACAEIEADYDGDGAANADGIFRHFDLSDYYDEKGWLGMLATHLIVKRSRDRQQAGKDGDTRQRGMRTERTSCQWTKWKGFTSRN